MKIYNPIEQGFSEDNCFLCGVPLTNENRTKEHVFPQWLINMFNLGTKKLSLLLNRKEIGYKQIIIPCCKKCNSATLAPLERRVRENFIDFDDDEFNLSDFEVALWAGKIYYGVYLYDYLDAMKDKDIDANLLEYLGDVFTQGDMKILHIYLQSLVKPIFVNCYDKDFPISVVHYNLQVPPHVNRQFDYKTSFEANSFMIRVGRKGFLISFDGGYLTKYLSFDFHKYGSERLHPLQLIELAAHFFTLSESKGNERKYLLKNHKEKITVDYLPDNFRVPYIFDGISDKFLEIFSVLLGREKSSLITGENSRLSYLEDSNGFFKMDVNS
ncbi:hypothetical protein [Labilibaculum euxinus]